MTGGEERQASDPDYAYCEDLLRQGDRDRWLASLFVPQERRRHIHALYAFSLEVARVRDIVSEPLLGEIRLQWWRDVLEGTTAGEAKASPVAAALLDTVARFGLPKAPLLELISARARNLYDDEIPTLSALESYAEATCASLFRLAVLILNGEETAAGFGVAHHAGIAYGITGLMLSLPWHSARGRVLVPAGILRAHGVNQSEFAARQVSPRLLAVLAEMRDLAQGHLDRFYAKLPGLPHALRPAFLPLCLCEPCLRLMEKSGYDPFKPVALLPQWKRQWILWRASRLWG